jgi:murein DD-endopeptidase MepM/ murein hydrolase activator NlpD
MEMAKRRWLFGVALGLASIVPSIVTVQTSGTRPLFQMPVPCGQTWDVSTYNGHWPDEDSIDMAERADDGDDISEGEPVLASAAGTVIDVVTSPGGDHRVYLDHGDGWATHW